MKNGAGPVKAKGIPGIAISPEDLSHHPAAPTDDAKSRAAVSASSPLVSSLHASHRKALVHRTAPSIHRKRKLHEDDEEDSEHDEAWHDI